jgi:hypothetical protein
MCANAFELFREREHASHVIMDAREMRYKTCIYAADACSLFSIFAFAAAVCSGGDVCAHVYDVITSLCMHSGLKNLHIATVRMTS